MIDIQYLYNISPRLDRFKKKSRNLFNFRCPYCGDSKKNKSKARGFVYAVKNEYFYKCHNCSKGTTLGKLIEHIDPQIYKQYVIEKYKSGNNNTVQEPEFKFEPVKFDDKALKDLTRFDKIPNHPAYKMFIENRHLKDYHDKLYVTWHFYDWVNKLIPNKFPNIKEDHPRVIIPFLDVDNKMFAFQGRAFGDEEPKYITIKLDENKRRIYGLDRLDINKTIYITEGPIDSLFLPNAIAVAGSDLEIKKLKRKAVYVFDNEPRNREITQKMEKLIEKNYNICIWPKSLKYKDINDMVMSGMTPVEIQSIIDNNTFSKLSAHQQLVNWKEV
jgi:transcription elongation factor Elf1